MSSDQATSERRPSRARRRECRCALRPFHEVGHDQEVAGEIHPDDDAELEFETVRDRPAPSAVRRPCSCRRRRAFTPACACARNSSARRGGRPSSGRSAAGSDCASSAGRRSAGDLDRVGDRLGKIGEQLRHFLGALETMLGREPAAVVSAIRRCRRRCTAARRAPRTCRRGRNEGIVGGDERQRLGVGEIDQLFFDRRFVRQAVALQSRHRDDRRTGRPPVASPASADLIAPATTSDERAVDAAGQRNKSSKSPSSHSSLICGD